jgi:diaminopimelate epimerase
MIPFIKASACGNDFLVIDGAHAPASLAEVSRKICDRHNGVGADGVEWLFPAQDAGTEARLINADGSEAEISGNGTRCVAACLVSQGAGGRLTIRTGAGVKLCELISREGNSFEFETEMGVPQVGASFAVETSKGALIGMPVSMGNPHYVVFTPEFSAAWQELGAEIGRQKFFTGGVNVEFVKVTGKSDLEVRFYERGVGETQSSGTGSCASAVAAIASAKAESPVRVHAPGGTQVVRWHGEQVFLRGAAQIICRGEFLL